MPKLNPYLVENKKPFETVAELKNEVPSFEEFMKTYESDEKVIDSYNLEVDSYKDIGVGKIFGPMPFVDEVNALIVARSQSIMDEMRRDYPTVVQLLNYNRAGVIEFLKAEGGLSAIEVIHDFDVRSTSNSSYGPEVWRKYKDEIYVYVDKICRKLTDENGRPIYQEELRPARRTLGEHIYDRYYEKLPRWPAPFCENTEHIKVEIGGSYRSGSYYVVWSCYGWIKVKDENRGFCDFKARFTGSPEIRVLLINLDFLASMERRFRNNIEGGQRFIDSEQDRNRGVSYSWERRYLSF